MADPNNVERFVKLAGFDPAKRPSLTDEILQEALREVQDGRRQVALERAKELIKKAVELREQAYKAEQEFNKNKRKFDEELGKVLNQLRVDVERTAGTTGTEQAAEEPAKTE